MIWNCLVLLSCVAVTLGSGLGSIGKNVYNDRQFREVDFDQGGRRNLENLRDAVVSKNYNNGAKQVVKDIAQKAQYAKGNNAASKSAGAQDSQVKQAHDKGFYERENKYGYEKAYGYDRETKQQDKASNAAAQGKGYNQNARRQSYSQGGEAMKDLSAGGNRGRYGSENYADKNVYIDLAADRNRGRDVASNYDSRYVNRVPYAQQIVAYAPLDYGSGMGMGGYGYSGLGGLGGYGGVGYGMGYGMGYGKGGMGLGYGRGGMGLGYGKGGIGMGYGGEGYGYSSMKYD